jgi:hypothetical protein
MTGERCAARRWSAGWDSGWRYPNWRGRFYPTGFRERSELGYAAERFSSIEINSGYPGGALTK